MAEDPKILAGSLLSFLDRHPNYDELRGKVKVKKEYTDALVHALLALSQAHLKEKKEANVTQARASTSAAPSVVTVETPPVPIKYLDTICDSIKERSGACTIPDCPKAHPDDCREFEKCQPRRHPDCSLWHTFLPLTVHLANQEQNRKRRRDDMRSAKATAARRTPKQAGNGNRRRKSVSSGPPAASGRTGSRLPPRPLLSQWIQPPGRSGSPHRRPDVQQHQYRRKLEQQQCPPHLDHPSQRSSPWTLPPSMNPSVWPPLLPSRDQSNLESALNKLRAVLEALS